MSTYLNPETGELSLTPFFRTPFNYSMDQASLESSLHCDDLSLAQQSAKDECDINVIMKNFGQGQSLPDNYRTPQFGDFTEIDDYHSAMNAVAKAAEAFDQLPAEMRYRFGNDPQNLLEFVADDKNRPEAIKLGLLPPPPVPAAPDAPKAPPVNP